MSGNPARARGTLSATPGTRDAAERRTRRASSGLDVVQVCEQLWVRRLPAECLACGGAGGRLVHSEDRADGPERFDGYLLDRYAEPAPDDLGDVADRVSLVVDGVPSTAGRCGLQCEAEEDCGV